MDPLTVLTSSITLFNTCLHSYRVVNKAMGLEGDARVWNVLMLIERNRFEVWGRTLGFLDKTTGRPKSTAEADTLSLDKLSPVLYMEHTRNLIPEILHSIYEALQEFDRKSAEFPTLASAGNAGSNDVAGVRETMKGHLIRIRIKGKVLSSSLMMVLKDKDQIEGILSTLSRLNDGLEKLMSIPQKVQATKAIASGVLPHFDTSTGLETVLEASASEGINQPRLVAAAHIKRRCLKLNEHDKGVPSAIQAEHITNFELDLASLGLDQTPRRSAREFFWPFTTGTMEAEPQQPRRVLVEWRAPGSMDFALNEEEMAKRRNLVTQLLREISKFPTAADYLTLNCLGWMKSTGMREGLPTDLVGFVSRIPDWADPSKDPITLHQLLSQAFDSLEPGSVPSLRTRFALAKQLATALYQLQCSQWLHRWFGSHNIVFFTDLNTQKLRLDEPRVIGLQYSRPDDQRRKNRSRQMVTEGGHAHWGIWGIYMQPDHLSENNNRRYLRSDDVFSLGIILFEIAFWEPAHAFFHEPEDGISIIHSVKSAQDDIKRAARTELAAEVGEIYSDAVLRCLNGLDRSSVEVNSLSPSSTSEDGEEGGVKRDFKENSGGSEGDENDGSDAWDESSDVPSAGQHTDEDAQYGLEEDFLWQVVRELEKCCV